ncbi:SH2 domain-containing protein 2A isoform X1 [Anser cygnoides]|uniref:SH2 domain-containing protein 2A isoform X1 n=1 Tax=Anser cygnoides TaxID=8845 RepID=UPI0034D28E97
MKSAAEGARGREGGGQGDVPKVPPPAPVPPAAPRRLSVTSAPPRPAVQLLRSPLPAPGGGATTGEAAALPHRQRPRPHTDPGSCPGLRGPGRRRDIGPMDDDRPLFSTFRPEDNAASTQPGNGATPLQPPRAEQPPEQRDAQGRAPPGWPPPGGGAQPELVALWARTRLWFEQTQARRLGAEGELPAWFHGFISRRETEQLLRDRPPGCFLVRFSESTVGFVLSYRGRERCRHFVLDQLPDGRYVILGERSAHAELAALLRHYAAAPVAPYREFLTVPCPRQDKPHGGVQPPGTSSPSPATPPAYSTVAKRPPGAGQAAGDGTEGSSGEAPGTPPPLPAKVGSSSAPQGPRSRAGSGGAAPEGPYAQVQREAVPAEPPEAKYQQLVRFHTYAEPRECAEPEEPIPFYAMGRGCGPAPEENVYSEVALAQRELPPLLPRGARGPVSTLPPKARAPTEPARRRLFRSFSSQASRRRQPPAAPTLGSGQRGAPSPPLEAPRNPSLEFDDPIYGQRKSSATRPAAPAGQEGQENIYEQLSGERP